MDPTEAARICGQAAKTLAEALGRETDADARSSLASALSKVAGRMDPAEAARVCGDVIRIVLQERSAEPRDRDTRNAIDGIVAMLLPRLDRGAAHLCAHELSMLMFAEADVNNADPTVRNRGMMGGRQMSGSLDREADDGRRLLEQPVGEHHLGGDQPGADRSPIADNGDRDRARMSGVACAVSNHRGRSRRRALPLPPHHARTGRPAQDADVLRRGPSGRPRPPGQPLRPAVRQPLGVRAVRPGAGPRTGLHHAAEAARSQGIARADAPEILDR